MAKVRVYELAKELGVESKVVMAKLNELGEFVRSASSTVEPPVVRKLRDALPAAARCRAAEGARQEGGREEGGRRRRPRRPPPQPGRRRPPAAPAAAAAAGARRRGAGGPAPHPRPQPAPDRPPRPRPAAAALRRRGPGPRPAGAAPGRPAASGQQPVHLGRLQRHGPPAAPRPGNNPYSTDGARACPVPVPRRVRPLPARVAPAVPAARGRTPA